MNRDKPNLGIALVFIALLMLTTAGGLFFQQENDNLITGRDVQIGVSPIWYWYDSTGTKKQGSLLDSAADTTRVTSAFQLEDDALEGYQKYLETQPAKATPVASGNSVSSVSANPATTVSPEHQRVFDEALNQALIEGKPFDDAVNIATAALLATGTSISPSGTTVTPAPTLPETTTVIESDILGIHEVSQGSSINFNDGSQWQITSLNDQTVTINYISKDGTLASHTSTSTANFQILVGNTMADSISSLSSLNNYNLAGLGYNSNGQITRTDYPGTYSIDSSGGLTYNDVSNTGSVQYLPPGQDGNIVSNWQHQLVAPAGTTITQNGQTYYVDSDGGLTQQNDFLSSWNPIHWREFLGIDTTVSSTSSNYADLADSLNLKNYNQQTYQPGTTVAYTAPDGSTAQGTVSGTGSDGRLTIVSQDGKSTSSIASSSVTSNTPPASQSIQIGQDQQGTLFYSINNQRTDVQYTDSSGDNYRTYVDSNGNVYASTGWISWFDKQIGHQNADGTVTLDSNLGGTVNMPTTATQKATSVPPGTTYDGDSWFFQSGYTATSIFVDPATSTFSQSQNGAASVQIYSRNGEYYTRTGQNTFDLVDLGASTNPADIVTQGGTSAWGDTLYNYQGQDYYVGNDGQVYANEWGPDNEASYNAQSAVLLARDNLNSLNEISSRTPVNIRTDSGASSTFYISPQDGSARVYDSQGREVTGTEAQKVIDVYTDQQNAEISNALFGLTMNLLNENMQEFKNDIVSDMCESDFGSSQSTGGTTPVTVADTSVPSVNNQTNISMYCSGSNDTTGTAQYYITDQYTFYTYDYGWTLQACKQDITYSIYFNPGQYPRENGTLSYDDPPAAVTTDFDKVELYSEICIQTDDSDFGNGGTACFPANSTPPARQEIINFTDECQSLGTFSENNTYDFYFAGNNYQDLTSISQDVSIAASLTSATDPFSTQYNNGKLNFYLVNNVFEDESMVDIRNYAITHCDYTHPNSRFTVILNPNKLDCEQSGYIVELNPIFAFKNETADASMNDLLNDFCTYVELLNYTNPPQVFMVTQSMQVNPGMIPIEFQIYDEEYPVNYELLFNNITIVNSSVRNSSVKSHTLDIPSGFWNLQIKSTDKRGNVAYSNIIQIFATELIDVYFGEDPAVDLPIGSLWNLDLNSFAEDPRGDAFVGWIHEPIYSDCIDFDPAGPYMFDGNIKLIGTQICQQNVSFEVIGTGNRRGRASILVNVIN